MKYLYNIYFIITFCLFFSCKKITYKEYSNPLNTIKSIKHKNSYSKIDLTIEKYYPQKKELLASFLYKKKKASVKLSFELQKNQLTFINIGKESDYFLYSISELFDEKILNPKMKSNVHFSFFKKGDEQKIDLFEKGNEYSLFFKPNQNYKGSVDIRMTINMELGKITFREKNNGIAKRNLVKAFEAINKN